MPEADEPSSIERRAGGDAPGAHPSLEDLHRYADGHCDSVRDAELLAHVERCESCRAEVVDTRRFTARLALSSAPPGDELLDRIRFRRATGEHVVLALPPTTPADTLPPPRTTGHEALGPSSRPWLLPAIILAIVVLGWVAYRLVS